jgi:hypothetical protein
VRQIADVFANSGQEDVNYPRRKTAPVHD